MINANAKNYQTFIEEELAAASATEWMAAGEGQVRYGEGREVEINTLNTTGLGDYDSTKTDGSAYPAGAVTSKWTGHTLAMDRGVKFALDHSAPEDISFPATVENVIREFAKTQLAREQDAYRIHRLYTLASQGEHADTHVLTYASDSDDIVDKLCTLAQNVEDERFWWRAVRLPSQGGQRASPSRPQTRAAAFCAPHPHRHRFGGAGDLHSPAAERPAEPHGRG